MMKKKWINLKKNLKNMTFGYKKNKDILPKRWR